MFPRIVLNLPRDEELPKYQQRHEEAKKYVDTLQMPSGLSEEETEVCHVKVSFLLGTFLKQTSVLLIGH